MVVVVGRGRRRGLVLAASETKASMSSQYNTHLRFYFNLFYYLVRVSLFLATKENQKRL
jgi:hypothetical protein